MNRFFPIVASIFLLAACSTTIPFNYFDENNNTLSESQFFLKSKNSDYLSIPGDFIHSKKLIVRQHNGKINNREKLLSYLNEKESLILDSTKPLIILYYPGKDPCNSSGTNDPNWIKDWYSALEKGLEQIADVHPIYLYKDPDGLQKYDGIIHWNKDPDHIIEKEFFQNHYPCVSFVVISTNGSYISYFGEFPKEYVWEATKSLQKQLNR